MRIAIFYPLWPPLFLLIEWWDSFRERFRSRHGYSVGSVNGTVRLDRNSDGVATIGLGALPFLGATVVLAHVRASAPV